MDRPIFREHFQRLPVELQGLTLHYLGLYVDQEQHSLQDLLNLAGSNPQEKDKIMTSIAQGYMQKSRQEGHQEGRQEGEQLGLQKGEVLGMRKGRKEGRQEALRLAVLGMHKLGLPMDTICKSTGLSDAEVKKTLS